MVQLCVECQLQEGIYCRQEIAFMFLAVKKPKNKTNLAVPACAGTLDAVTLLGVFGI